MNWIEQKDKLEYLINVEKASYEEIGRKYGCTGSNIKKQAKKLGIILPKRRKISPNETFNKGKHKSCYCLFCGKRIKRGRKFCNNKHQQAYEYNEYIKRWKEGLEKGSRGEYSLSSYIRNYMLRKALYKCELCGWGEVNKYTGTVPLEIHHIDGNYMNNKEENLQVLCPNCHSLTETYKSHNKKGRSGRRKYNKPYGEMVELVDTVDLKSPGQ